MRWKRGVSRLDLPERIKFKTQEVSQRDIIGVLVPDSRKTYERRYSPA